MSRIRIVNGTITKTTEGVHDMYSEENIVFNSSKTITEVGEENGIVFGRPKDTPIKVSEKQITSAIWMCGEMKNEIHTTCIGHKVSIYVKTLNYKPGEIISLEIIEVDNKDIKKGIKNLTVSGIIKEDGSAELNEILEIEKV